MRQPVSSASFWRWIGSCALAVFFAVIAGVLIVAPAAVLDRGDQIASILACVIGLGSLLLSAVSLRLAARATGPAEADPDAMPRRAAGRLADVVRRQWSAEADARLVLAPDPLRVRWSTTERRVSAPAEQIVGAGMPGRALRLRLAGDVTEVAGTFRGLPAGQLVVLGEPGAGKSVLALLLTLELLRDRAADDVVPVLFTASSWLAHEHLDDWLVRRLAEDYPALRDDPGIGVHGLRRLVDSGRVLPIIDALDEVDARHRTAAVRMVRRYAAADRRFVLTCRSAEFESAVQATGTPLARAAVVELQPVTGEQAREYLSVGQIDGDQRWAPVLERLTADPDGPLAQALSSPLMVYLARTAYADGRTTPAELCDDAFATSDRVERHLFDSYLPAVYDRQHGRPDRWLTFLAAHLQRQGSRDLAWWEIADAVPGWRYVAIGYGAVAGAIGVGLPVLLAAGRQQGLVAAAIGAAGVALLGLLTIERGNRRLLGLPYSGWHRSVIRSIRYGATIGLPTALLAGTLLAVVGREPAVVLTLILALYLGGVAGLLLGRVRGQAPTALDSSTITPASVLRNDRRATLITVGAVTLAGCVSTALAVRLMGQSMSGIGVVGFLAGVGCGTAVALWANPRNSWLSYLAAHYYLAARGRLPWRLMRFLDDAHDRGVLRRAGALYQFRHARLQDYLAEVARAQLTSPRR